MQRNTIQFSGQTGLSGYTALAAISQVRQAPLTSGFPEQSSSSFGGSLFFSSRNIINSRRRLVFKWGEDQMLGSFFLKHLKINSKFSRPTLRMVVPHFLLFRECLCYSNPTCDQTKYVWSQFPSNLKTICSPTLPISILHVTMLHVRHQHLPFVGSCNCHCHCHQQG